MFDCYRMILPDGTFLGNASDLPDDVVNVAETMEESVHSLNVTRVRDNNHYCCCVKCATLIV